MAPANPPSQTPTSSTETRAPLILVGNIIPQVFATIFVVARILSKSWLSHTWGHDDSTLCLSWITSLALTVTSCLQTRYGAGRHLESVAPPDSKPRLQLAYGALILYHLALCLTKVSVCIFYTRVFPDRRNRLLSGAMMGFVAAYTVALEAVAVTQCKPASAAYDKTIVGGTCIDTVPAFYASAACNLAADVWIIAHAVPRVLPLQIPRRQKGLLLFFLSLGWLTIVASVLRVVRLSTVLREADKTWVSFYSSIWTAVEVGVGLVCVSAPATWKLVKKMAPRFAAVMTSDPSDRGRRRSSGSGSGNETSNDAGGSRSDTNDFIQKHSSEDGRAENANNLP